MLMTWQGLEASASLVAAAGTIGTLLYGINQYNSQEIGKILAQLRDESSEIKQTAGRLDGLLNDASFTAIAQHLTNDLDSLVPSANSAAEYINNLEKVDGELIACAMIPLSYTFPLLEIAENHSTKLVEIAGRQIEYFPALKRMMFAASQLVSDMSRQLLSSYIPRRIFEEEGFYDPKQFWLTTRKIAEHAENVAQARLGVARSLATLSSEFWRNECQNKFGAAQKIITIVTERVEKASTNELKALKRSARKSDRATNKIIKKTDTWDQEIAELAHSIKNFLGKEAHNEIMQQCAAFAEEVDTEGERR